MYYPKQIPYLFHPAFQKEILYKEYQMPELDDYCMCIWQIKSNQEVKKPVELSILPDACIDLVIDFVKQTIRFSGFSRDTEKLILTGEIDYLGVRMKPGAFYALFQISADKIIDHALSFSEVEKKSNFTSILKLKNTEERIQMIESYLKSKITTVKNSDFFIQFVEQLYEKPIFQSVDMLSENFGYDERQLFRIFKKHYGVSPKVLLNILRLHLCFSLLFDERKNLNDIIHICGFYDQSHFIKEIKKYTGISPFKLLEAYQLSLSVFYNTKLKK
ncbi:MAG: helix-turn-helix transcriptional regulator [Firmicutes bacterium]|nr:helix-turn-helix transcriptional regulator [Bacillota bacterium]